MSVIDQAADRGQSRPALGADHREPVHLTWAAVRGLVGLSIKNLLLMIITLGIYGFWGKTEVRRRIWSGVRLNGEPLQYTGTGKELFMGFLVVLGVVIVPTMLVSFAAGIWLPEKSPGRAAFDVAMISAYALLFGVALHRANRYRLTRTRWRGIRGGLEGGSLHYAWTFLWTTVVAVLTLGWALPWRSTKLQGLITNGMRFGDRPFQFTASCGPLYPKFAVVWFGCLILSALAFAGVWIVLLPNFPQLLGAGLGGDPVIKLVLVLSIYGAVAVGFLIITVLFGWYRARRLNHFADHTLFEGARLQGHATAPSMIWLSVSNYLLVFFTLGLLTPVAQARSMRYMAERLSVEGDVPLAAIAQRAEDNLRRGEGLAQAFDVDAF